MARRRSTDCHMDLGPHRRLMIVCVAAALTVAPITVAQTSQPAPTMKLAVAGNDSVLWLIVGQQESQQEVLFNRFAFQDKSSAKIFRITGIRPQQGRIERWAVVGEDLHVFFGPDKDFSEDGAHYSYKRPVDRSLKSGVRREIHLPGPVMPIAVAGESTGHQPRLWAVVSAATAAEVKDQWELEQATQPAELVDEKPNDETTLQPLSDTIAPSESASYQLVFYEGMSWQPGFPATDECNESQRVWLALSEDRVFLFWHRSKGDPSVHCAWRQKDQKGQWEPAPSILFDQPLVDGFAGVINRELVFAALVLDKVNPQRLQCRIWVFRTDSDGRSHWQRSAAVIEDSADPEKELSLAMGSSVGGCFDRLVVLRPAEQGAEVAFFSPSLGGAPSEPFCEVPLTKVTPGAEIRRGLRDLAAILVVLAVVALVFWRRQESISTPVAVPIGLRVAGTGKRALMALVDMVPAGAIVIALWFDPISGFCREFYDAAKTGQIQALEALQWPESLTWAWMWFRLIYVAYCIVFEIIWQATPGKRLLRSAVTLETLERPNAVHIIIRNVTKLIELEPYLQIWPFMLVIFLMRNNQRVGDLLARTIVVERQD